ncbi:MAG: hypothetical protein SV186_07045 [Candidatus Nanohaloarchaea archaeon]|nr:hypothetical protein [Candidatus Nanohaloarchaea archaeon]
MCGQRYTCDECGTSTMLGEDSDSHSCPECGAQMSRDPPGGDER